MKKIKEIEEIEKKINNLREEIYRLQLEKKEIQKKDIEDKINAGWKKFVFYSEYYGSHSEYGEDDIETVYLFAPHIDIEPYANMRFAHGHASRDENNDKFKQFLATLEEGKDYIEIEEEVEA